MQHIALTLACLVALTSALPTSHHNHTADDLHDDLHDNIHLNETERELADSNSTALEMDNGHGELNGTDDGHHGHGHDHPHSHDDVPEHFEATTTNVMISAVQTGEVNANGTETKTKHSHHCRHHNHDGNKEIVDGSEDSTSVDEDDKSDESADIDGDSNEKDSETDSDEDDCKEESDSKDNSDGAEEEKASESDESGEYSDERSIDYSDNRSGSSLTSAEKDEKRKQYLNEGIEEFDRDIKKFLDSIGQGDLYHQLSSASTISSFTTLTLLAFMASLLV